MLVSDLQYFKDVIDAEGYAGRKPCCHTRLIPNGYVDMSRDAHFHPFGDEPCCGQICQHAQPEPAKS